jgi:hypothetical protein
MSKVRDFAEKKDTSIPDVILKATKSSVFRINEKLHNGKQGFALTKKGFTPRPPPQCKASSLTIIFLSQNPARSTHSALSHTLSAAPTLMLRHRQPQQQ